MTCFIHFYQFTRKLQVLQVQILLQKVSLMTVTDSSFVSFNCDVTEIRAGIRVKPLQTYKFFSFLLIPYISEI